MYGNGEEMYGNDIGEGEWGNDMGTDSHPLLPSPQMRS